MSFEAPITPLSLAAGNGPAAMGALAGEHTSKLKLATMALAFAALSAGVALCINVVHYQTWPFVPAATFGPFHDTSGMRDAGMAALVGIPNLVLALLLARKGLPGVARAPLWVAAALALMPWIVTPLFFLPLQARIGDLGATPELVGRLVSADLLLRALPLMIQACIHLGSLVRSLNGVGAGAAR